VLGRPVRHINSISVRLIAVYTGAPLVSVSLVVQAFILELISQPLYHYIARLNSRRELHAPCRTDALIKKFPSSVTCFLAATFDHDRSDSSGIQIVTTFDHPTRFHNEQKCPRDLVDLFVNIRRTARSIRE